MVQNEDPDDEGGANGICLREAQYEFIKESPDREGGIKVPSWHLVKSPSR